MLNFIRKFVASKIVKSIPFIGRFSDWLATAPGARRYVAMFALTLKLSVSSVAGAISGVCETYSDLAGAVCSVDMGRWVSVSGTFADSVVTWLNNGADLSALFVIAWSYFESKDKAKA